jgi:hypothetical protein
MELFQLVNPDKMSITCVGYAPSCRRRCRNPIAYHNVQAAKEVMRQVVRPGVSDADLKEMLYDLAEHTLCRRYHQNQATDVSDRWFATVQRYRDDEEDRGSDTSDDDDGESDDGASSTTSSSDDSDDDDIPSCSVNDNTQELRRRFDELETLQREFEELLQRQRQSLQDRVARSALVSQRQRTTENRRQCSEANRSSTTYERRDQEEAPRHAEHAHQEADYLTAQRRREATREQLRRDRVDQVRREEAQRQAEARLEAEAKAKAKAQAQADRLRREQKAFKSHLDQERQAKGPNPRQPPISSWETAWLRYESAWADLTPNPNSTITSVGGLNTDIRTTQIWPTKTGSFTSCCEEDVRAFFRCLPGDGVVSRRVLRRQALRWHPDRAARLFAVFTGVKDGEVGEEVLRTVTMISQVVIGVMGVAKQ